MIIKLAGKFIFDVVLGKKSVFCQVIRFKIILVLIEFRLAVDCFLSFYFALFSYVRVPHKEINVNYDKLLLTIEENGRELFFSFSNFHGASK
jgi:hypothetical protein